MTSRGDINRAWEDRQGTSERAILRTRIAELEAEAGRYLGRLVKAEARLAAVIELCDTDDQGYDWSCFVSDVRAAATGT